MITDADIKSFQELYKKHFQLDIANDDAKSKLLLLVKQTELLFSADPQSNNEHGDKNEQGRPELYS